MGTQTALIFGAMPCRSWGHLDALRAEKPLVICADGGVHCAAAAGFAPDCYVGDGDSGGTAVAGAENILLRPEKDESDLQAAYTMARAHGCTRLYLTACTGGRLDHALANLQLLETARADGVEAILLDPDNRVTCIGPGGVHASAHGLFLFFPASHRRRSARRDDRGREISAPRR